MASQTLLLGVAFALFAVPASVIDAKRYRVPNVCTIGGTFVLLSLQILVLRAPIALALAGPALGCGLFMLVRIASGRGLGLGDVKLALLVGAATGPFLLPLAVALGSACAALWALFAGRRSGVSIRAVTIPFAPFLTIGTSVTLAVSAAVVSSVFG